MSVVANRLGDNTNQTWTSGCSLPLTELLNEFRKSQRGKKTQTMQKRKKQNKKTTLQSKNKTLLPVMTVGEEDRTHTLK